MYIVTKSLMEGNMESQVKSIRRSILTVFALLLLVVVSFGIVGGCNGDDGNNGNGGSQPTPMPTSTPSPTPMPTPDPTPPPGTSILMPGGTLSMTAQSFDYTGNANPRQFLDFYGLTLPAGMTASTRGELAVRPAIVFVHGGAWVAGDKGDVLDEPIITDVAEQAGFHLISVGYRLATEAAWPAQAHDVNAAIRWIKQNAGMLDVDPERLVLVGGSAGAHIGAAVAMGPDVDELQGPENLEPPTSTDVALAFLIFGAYDMDMIVQDGLDLVADMTCGLEDLVAGAALFLLLDCPPSLDLFDPLAMCSQQDLDSASPVLSVDSMDPPTYLAHGRDDCVVPFQQTIGMEMALESAGVLFESMIVPGGEHDVDSLMLESQSLLDFIDDNMEP